LNNNVKNIDAKKPSGKGGLFCIYYYSLKQLDVKSGISTVSEYKILIMTVSVMDYCAVVLPQAVKAAGNAGR